MKRTTNRLAGPALRRFFEQFLENDGELERSAATRVAHRLTQAIPAALVRCDTAGKLWTLHRMRRVRPCATSAPQATPIRATPTSGAQAQGLAPTDGAAGDTAAATAGPTAQTTPGAQAAAQPLPSQPPQAPPESAAGFDPYAFGLVPTFQREGATGLATKLNAITTVDDLRKMARAQQIALPADIRRGNVDAQAVRAAIVAAVAKRIADRRAAAS